MDSSDRASGDQSSGMLKEDHAQAIQAYREMKADRDRLREEVKKLRIALEAIYDECDGREDVEDCRDGSGVRPNSWMRIGTTARDALEETE